MSGWDELDSALERGPGALFHWLLYRALILLTLLGVGGCTLVMFGFISNPLRQAARIVDETIDADNVIANYEWFKQRHEDVAAIDRKIADATLAVATHDDAAGPRQDWHREDREEHARLSSIALGLKQQRADLVAEYNARSRMANRTIFKAGDVELPERIEE